MPIQNKFEKKVPTMSSDIARWPVIEKKNRESHDYRGLSWQPCVIFCCQKKNTYKVRFVGT
jgi:hypothetical protein